jgi:hypothetical protein
LDPSEEKLFLRQDIEARGRSPNIVAAHQGSLPPPHGAVPTPTGRCLDTASLILPEPCKFR